MKTGKLFIVILIFVIILGGGYAGWKLITKSNTGEQAEQKGYGLNTFALVVEAEDTKETLWVQADRQMIYSTEKSNQLQYQGFIVEAEDMSSILGKLSKNNFFDLTEKISEDDTGEIYRLIGTLTAGPDIDPENAIEHEVSCFKESCSSAIVEIADEVLRVWGYPLGEKVAGREIRVEK